MDYIDTIETISEDFEQDNPPFDDVQFPEERLLRELKIQIGDTDESVSLSMEDRLKAISAFATFDYNRDANQLVDNLLELQERKSEWFDAYSMAPSQYDVEEVFKDIGFRYGSRDARGWYHNNNILRQKYHGEWHELLMETGLDAVSLVQQLKDDDFLYLKGDKIAPMYARIIDDEVASLSNLWELDIPVDTHIRRLSKELFAAHSVAPEPKLNDDDFIRSLWREVADEHGIERHVVDGALWHIGNKWDDWGSEYWNTFK